MANNRIVILDFYYKKIGTIDDIDMPIFVYIDRNDNILVNEMATHRILKYSPQCELIDSWGGKGSEDGKFNIPRSLVQDSKGYYYVSDELNHRIQVFTETGEFVVAHGGYGSANGDFKVQQGISIDSSDRLYVADTYNNRIQVFQTQPSWQHLKTFGEYGIYNPFNYFSF